jgi:F-type H+-transporting ATPase subunit delta
MPEASIGLRYARALFRLSEQEGNTESLQRETRDLRVLVEESADLSFFLNHITLSTRQKDTIARALFEGKSSASLTRLVRFLAERGRLPILPDICDAYDALYRESRNILVAEVTSAYPLRDEQIESIRDKMKLRHGKTIEMKVDTDPALLGGFVIRVLDQVDDFSIKGKLEGLRTTLCAA